MEPRPPAPDLAELVAAHHAVLYRYAYRLTGSREDAEDLTQQTFLQAQAHLSQLREPERARSWLCTILRNGFQMFCRQRQRAPVECWGEEIATVAAPEEDDPELDSEALQAALLELPEEFRVVLVMYYFEDCSYREIADRLELPTGTVMSRLSRAKGHLRARLFPPESETQGPIDATGRAAEEGCSARPPTHKSPTHIGQNAPELPRNPSWTQPKS